MLEAASLKKQKVDVAKPNIFDGQESKLDAFLHQLQLVFWADASAYANENSRITYALSYMKQGRALAWAQRFMEVHLRPVSPPLYDITYNVFEEMLKISFGAADPTLNAVDKLRKLQQGSMSADEYIVAFEEHEPHTQWDDKALKDQFELGLSPGLAASIYRLEKMPETLSGWKTWAHRLDRQWRQYEEKQKLHKAAKLAQPQPQSQTKVNFKEKFKWPDTTGNASRTEPDVSTRRDGTGVTFGGRGQPMDLNEARRKRLCFSCGEAGHQARFCPHKPRQDVRKVVLSLEDKVDKIQEVLDRIMDDEDKPKTEERFGEGFQ
ncbi:hypothetical protein PsYK624_168350 [Phanerochaete sordida]|uniref:CCHC-type domain-containing protein n=1 Tax=Phanerochaete sordida TaxID=48140 RepID=A0A9P3LMG5_9APHY|nr:hypothetical protein PsYK624_168350 [Phanerochaete sordida]